jgi:HEAT repeat protein
VELLLLLLLLASDSVEARDFATARLVELGPVAWPSLERFLEAPDAELRLRAADILVRQELSEPLLRRRPHLVGPARSYEAARLIRATSAAAASRLLAIREWSFHELVRVLEDPRAPKRSRAFSLYVLEKMEDSRALLALLRTSEQSSGVTFEEYPNASLASLAQRSLLRLGARKALASRLEELSGPDLELAKKYLAGNE